MLILLGIGLFKIYLRLKGSVFYDLKVEFVEIYLEGVYFYFLISICLLAFFE